MDSSIGAIGPPPLPYSAEVAHEGRKYTYVNDSGLKSIRKNADHFTDSRFASNLCALACVDLETR